MSPLTFSQDMDQRTEAVLEKIIVHYIETAEPIGSRALSKTLKPKLSAATIRNIMADLTDMGLIKQPHTSAGRLPTDLGYRHYINALFSQGEITPFEYKNQNLRDTQEGQPTRLEDILVSVSRELSKITNCTSIAIPPTPAISKLNKIEFIKLSIKQILAVIVTQLGMVHNRVIYLQETPDQETLDKMGRILIDLFERRTFSTIRQSILNDFKDVRYTHSKLIASAIHLGKKAFEVDTPSELFVLGHSKFCSFPEFKDQERLEIVYKLLEEKTALSNILADIMEKEGVQIQIGKENNNHSLYKCSVVASTYGDKGKQLGSIGIVGPTRINYPKIIAAIDYSAQKLSFSLRQFLDHN